MHTANVQYNIAKGLGLVDDDFCVSITDKYVIE